MPAILSSPIVLLAIAILGPLLRDFLVGALHGIAKKWKGDKDPKNDSAAAALDAAADALAQVRAALPPLGKK